MPSDESDGSCFQVDAEDLAPGFAGSAQLFDAAPRRHARPPRAVDPWAADASMDDVRYGRSVVFSPHAVKEVFDCKARTPPSPLLVELERSSGKHRQHTGSPAAVAHRQLSRQGSASSLSSNVRWRFPVEEGVLFVDKPEQSERAQLWFFSQQGVPQLF